MSRRIFLTGGYYGGLLRSNPVRLYLQWATQAHWKNLGCEVKLQPGISPEDQRHRYIDALRRSDDEWVTISDDDIALRPHALKMLHKDPVLRWDEYVQYVFDANPDYGYLGPWLVPCDGKAPNQELVDMSVCGGIRFVRRGALDPDNMLPATAPGYDMHIAKMLKERGWKCAKLPRLRAHHWGRGFSVVDETVADYA